MMSKCILIFIINLLLFNEIITAWHYSRSQNHKYQKRPSYAAKQRLMMPSGKVYYITTPNSDHRWKCGEPSLIIDLDPRWGNLKSARREFIIVKKEMENTWGLKWTGHQVLRVQKIINPCLWKKYKNRKATIMNEMKNVTEMFLWHGSPAVNTLVDKGFDERYANLISSKIPESHYRSEVHMTAELLGPEFETLLPTPLEEKRKTMVSFIHGDGVPAILLPAVSCCSVFTRLMLLCRVLLGNVHVVNSSGRFPNPPPGFHSVKGNWALPEFIVYRGEQAYPEFLVTYK